MSLLKVVQDAQALRQKMMEERADGQPKGFRKVRNAYAQGGDDEGVQGLDQR